MPFVFRGIADREIDDDKTRMTETLEECGHTIFFTRAMGSHGQSRWFDENGRVASLASKTRQCWQCEAEQGETEQ